MNWKPRWDDWQPPAQPEADPDGGRIHIPPPPPPPPTEWDPEGPTVQIDREERGSTEIDDTIDDDEDPTVIITTRLSPQIHETLR